MSVFIFYSAISVLYSVSGAIIPTSPAPSVEALPVFKEYTFNVTTQNFYKVHTTRKSWSDASDHCKQEGAALFVPDSKEDIDAASSLQLTTLAIHPPMPDEWYSAWIGIHDTFSKGDFVAVDGKPIKTVFVEWAAGEPKNEGNKDCVLLNRGMMNVVSCETEAPFICKKSLDSLHSNSSSDSDLHTNQPIINTSTQKSPASSSESSSFLREEYTFNVKTKNFYKVHAARKNWSDAFDYCKQEGAALFVPDSRADRDAARDLLVKTIPKFPGMPIGWNSAWIGIHDTFSEGDFVTEDGNPIVNIFVDWAAGEPNNAGNEDCVILRTTGKMNDVPCEEECPFICKKSHSSMGYDHSNSDSPTDPSVISTSTQKLPVSSTESPSIVVQDYTFNAKTQTFYKIHATRKSWSEANDQCKQEGAILFVPDSRADRDAARDLLVKSIPKFPGMPIGWNSAWIGIHDTFSEGEFVTVNGKTIESIFVQWAAGEPNNAGNEDCVILRTTGKMNDVSCEEEAPFICKKSGTSLDSNNSSNSGLLPNLQVTSTTTQKSSVLSTESLSLGHNYTFNVKTQNFYKIHATRKSWSDANDQCKQEGAILFVPDSRADRDAARDLLIKTIPKFPGMPIGWNSAWIGIHDNISEGVFVTVDGKAIEDIFVEWAAGEPSNSGNEDCVILRTTGKMNDVSCDEEAPFICKISPVSSDSNTSFNSGLTTELPDTSVSTESLPHYKRDYIFNAETQKFYRIHTTGKSWLDANNVCMEEGSELFVPKTMAESDAARDLLLETLPVLPEVPLGLNYVWIGIHDQFFDGHYVSVNGEPMEDVYMIWGDEPKNNIDGNCVVLRTNGKVKDASCENKAPFICAKSLASLDKNQLPDSGLPVVQPNEHMTNTELVPFFRNDYCFNTVTQNFYKLHTIKKSWFDAHKRCKQEGAALFIPDSRADRDAARDLINKKHPTYPGMPAGYNTVWIGIHDQFSEGDFVTIDGRNIDNAVFVDWANGEPNNYGNEDCVCLRANGKMNDSPCQEDAGFICKKTRASLQWNTLCQLPDIQYAHDEKLGKCYKLHLSPKKWEEANAVCTAEESYLAVVNSEAEANYITQLIIDAPKTDIKSKNFYPSAVYLGFHNIFQNEWATIDGQSLEEAGYSRWEDGQPEDNDKLCGGISFNGTLTQLDCKFRAIFLCEHDISSSSIVKQSCFPQFRYF